MGRKNRTGQVFRSTLIVALLAVLNGCASTTTVELVAEQAPPERYQNVAVGVITAKYAQWNVYSAELRSDLVGALIKTDMFALVMDPAPQPLPPSTVLVTGQVTDADPDGTALWWLGLRLVGAHLTGEFQLIDADGNVMARFSAGARIEGPGMDFDDLVRQIGQDTAVAIVKWSVTGKLK